MAATKKVVIIGGGFAGLGSLTTLTNHDCFSVTLLEASDALGGRIKTVEGTNNLVLELGATYIHGEEGNSLYEIAKNVNMTKKIANNVRKNICLMSNGKEVDESHHDLYSDVITDIFEEMVFCADKNDWSFVLYPDKKEWLKKSHSVSPSPNTITEYIRERFESITRTASTEPRFHSSILDSILDHWLLREAILNGTSYSNEVDINSYNEFHFPLGDDNILLTYGYKGLLQAMTADVKHLCIFTKKVCHIELSNQQPRANPVLGHSNNDALVPVLGGHSNDESIAPVLGHSNEPQAPAPVLGGHLSLAPVLVYCNDGSYYEADHVIITVSLGVLKDKSIAFTPPLPSCKQTAINKLGMGLVDKVILAFPTAIMPDDIWKVSFLWCKEERVSLGMDYPWAVFMYCMHHIPNSNSWIFWFAGDEAKMVEQLADEELSKGIVSSIEMFLKRRISTPVSVSRVKWGLDELFKGSYSYNKTGSNKRDREELTKPLGETQTPLQLLFAGEATNGTNYSTTNGAYDSGVREANRLIDHYNII